MSKAAELANLIGNINAGGGGVNRNVVINGAMNVAQRATSKANVASSGYYVCDRFRVGVNTGGRSTLSQDSSSPSGFANSLKIACTTADTSVASDEVFSIQHKIEGQNLQGFAKGTSDAKPFAVSFYVKGNASATFACELIDNDNSRQITKLFNVTTDWTRVKLSFPPDTTGTLDDDNASSMTIVIWLHAGSDFTSGTLNSSSWASSVSANRAGGISSIYDSTDRTFFITGFQMEVGQNPTSFEHEPFERTLAKCYRYTQRLPHFDNTSGGGYAGICTVGRNDNTTLNSSSAMLPVTMREDPAIESQSGNFRIHHANTGTATTNIQIDDEICTSGVIHFNSTVSSGLTAGDGGQLQQNGDSDAHLIIESEL